MDYSAANMTLWNIVIQLGLIAGAILLANLLRQRVPFIRKSLMPIAVLAGFILLVCKYIGIAPLDGAIMEILVFLSLFILIVILVRKLVVQNIDSLNGSLSRISDGDLDVTVDVRNSEEFASLSDDINTTVTTLKKYIADASARIPAL